VSSITGGVYEVVAYICWTRWEGRLLCGRLRKKGSGWSTQRGWGRRGMAICAGEWKCMQGFGANVRETDHLEDLAVDEKV
jgi:hypothetical protein